MPEARAVGYADRAGILARFGLFGVSLLIFLLLLEVGLRVVQFAPPNLMFDALTNQMHQVHLDTFATLVRNDPELFWVLAPHQTLPEDSLKLRGLISNGAGLREEQDIPFAKPAGQFRVLFVGDSCTFGFGVTHRETFVEGVERRLRARFPERDIACINAGVPGYTLAQGWAYLRREGLRYQPDIVLCAFGWNDQRRWSSFDDLTRMEQARRATPPGLLRWSEVCRQAWSLSVQWKHPETSNKVARVSAPTFARLLDGMHELCANKGAHFIPMVWPVEANVKKADAGWTAYQKATALFQPPPPRADPSVIDLLPAIERALMDGWTVRDLFMDGVHPTARAHDYIAERIADALTPLLEHVPPVTLP